MGTIYYYIYDPDRLLLNLLDKMNVKKNDKHVTLPNYSIYYTWKNIREMIQSNKFKISTPTWNGEFELPSKSYSLS